MHTTQSCVTMMLKRLWTRWRPLNLTAAKVVKTLCQKASSLSLSLLPPPSALVPFSPPPLSLTRSFTPLWLDFTSGAVPFLCHSTKKGNQVIAKRNNQKKKKKRKEEKMKRKEKENCCWKRDQQLLYRRSSIDFASVRVVLNPLYRLFYMFASPVV